MNCFASRTLFSRLLIAFLPLVSLAQTSHAQIASPLLRVNVPFDFENGSHRFAAGVYFVRVEADRRLVLQGAKDRLITSTVPDEDRDVPSKSTVVFRRYGDRYFLRGVAIAGQRTRVHCPPTKTEKQVELALKNQNKPGVMVALLNTSK